MVFSPKENNNIISGIWMFTAENSLAVKIDQSLRWFAGVLMQTISVHPTKI